MNKELTVFQLLYSASQGLPCLLAQMLPTYTDTKGNYTLSLLYLLYYNTVLIRQTDNNRSIPAVVVYPNCAYRI